MEINISHAADTVPVTIFHIQGRINLGTADDLKQKAQAVFEDGAHNLLLDLSGVKSITSEGLRVIHTIYRLYLDKPSREAVNEKQPGVDESPIKATHFKLLNPSSDILRVLKISGFDRFIEIYENLDDAVESFGS